MNGCGSRDLARVGGLSVAETWARSRVRWVVGSSEASIRERSCLCPRLPKRSRICGCLVPVCPHDGHETRARQVACPLGTTPIALLGGGLPPRGDRQMIRVRAASTTLRSWASVRGRLLHLESGLTHDGAPRAALDPRPGLRRIPAFGSSEVNRLAYRDRPGPGPGAIRPGFGADPLYRSRRSPGARVSRPGDQARQRGIERG